MSRRRPTSLSTVSRATTTLLVMVAVAVFAASAFSLLGLSRARHRQGDVLDAAVSGGSQLLDLYLDQETGLRGFLTTGDTTFLQPYQTAAPRIPGVEAALAHLVASVPKAPPELAQVVAAHRQWLARYAQPAMAEVEAGHLDEARQVTDVSQGKTLFDAIRSAMRTLNGTVAAAQHANEASLGTREAQLWVVLAVSLLALLLAAGGAAYINRRLVIAPLAALGEQVALVAGGDLEHRVAGQGPDEIGRLAGGVEAMRARLAASIDEARRSAEALTQEGPAVTALRRALAPAPTQLAGIEVAGHLQPATGVLAGDWWDAFALPEGRSAMVLGDVAGHGAEAGVYAVQLKHLIANALRAGLDPGAALGAALAETAAMDDERFATAFVAVVEPGRGQIAYASAGHPDGLIVAHHGGRPGPVPSTPAQVAGPATEAPTTGQPTASPGAVDAPDPDPPEPGPQGRRLPLLARTGPLLSSIVAGRTWACRIEAAQPGDTLIAVTDGITEARNDEGEEFGTDRLVEAVGASGEGHDPREIASAVLECVNRFARRGHAADDRTIVVARLADPTRRYPLDASEGMP